MKPKKIYVVGFWIRETFFSTRKWSFVDQSDAERLASHWQRAAPNLGICIEDMDELRAKKTRIQEWDY